jgi:hypothetical protein
MIFLVSPRWRLCQYHDTSPFSCSATTLDLSSSKAYSPTVLRPFTINMPQFSWMALVSAPGATPANPAIGVARGAPPSPPCVPPLRTMGHRKTPNALDTSAQTSAWPVSPKAAASARSVDRRAESETTIRQDITCHDDSARTSRIPASFVDLTVHTGAPAGSSVVFVDRLPYPPSPHLSRGASCENVCGTLDDLTTPKSQSSPTLPSISSAFTSDVTSRSETANFLTRLVSSSLPAEMTPTRSSPLRSVFGFSMQTSPHKADASPKHLDSLTPHRRKVTSDIISALL